MWTCPACGQKNQDQSKHCRSCGAKTPERIFCSEDMQKIASASTPNPLLICVSISVLILGIIWLLAESRGLTRVSLNYIPLSWIFIFIGAGFFIAYAIRHLQAKKLQNISIQEQGLSSGDQFMAWKDITHIYQYGILKKTRYLGTPGGQIQEGKFLKIKDANGSQLKFYWLKNGGMDPEVLQVHNKLVNLIIAKTMHQQIKEFVNTIESGQIVDFRYFGYTKDGLLFPQYQNGRIPLPFSRIREYYSSKDGNFYLKFLDQNNRAQEAKMGSIKHIPNMHILKFFLDRSFT